MSIRTVRPAWSCAPRSPTGGTPESRTRNSATPGSSRPGCGFARRSCDLESLGATVERKRGDMSEQQGRQSQSHGNGHGGVHGGLNDGDEDYDGGLRAAAEGGRVAVFRGAGRPVQQQAPEVDSPFLGLFDDPSRRARPELPAPPAPAPVPPPVSAMPISAPPTATPEDLRPAVRNG